MKISGNSIIPAVVALVLCAQAGAATLSFAPSAITAVSGSTFAVELVISGLGDGDAPSLGDFDIHIGFDPFALDWVASSLGTALGDVGLGEALDVSFGEVAPGLVNIAEVSFLTVGELNGLQSDSFVIATLDFMVLAPPGTSTPIDILGVLSLGDAAGDSIVVDGVSGSIVSVTAIPLPAAAWLFASALGIVSLARSRRTVSL